MKLEEASDRNYNRPTENERYIYWYLLGHKKECAVMSITKFTGNYHMSEPMLMRFAKKSGLAGYGKLEARSRLEEQETEEAPGPEEELLNTMTDSCHKMMGELIDRGLDSLFEKLYRARRVSLYGNDLAQTRIASEMKRIFLPVEEMFRIHGYDTWDILPRVMTKRDIAVIMSLTGEFEVTVSLARELRLGQVPILSITRLGNNILVSVCDKDLYIHSITLPARYGIEYEIPAPYFILIEYLYLTYQEFLRCRLDLLQIFEVGISDMFINIQKPKECTVSIQRF